MWITCGFTHRQTHDTLLDSYCVELEEIILKDLSKLKLIDTKKVEFITTKSFKYAYVIYDNNHRKNTDIVLNYLRSVGITPLGRFGTFEYINSDKAIELAEELAKDYLK